jgi:thiol-disulfide isomerase/thioredoxin
MRWFRLAVLYTALALSANAALAGNDDLIALREGDMKKLIFHAEPKDVSQIAFLSETGENMTLADLQGKVVLLNFWATWCAPCRKEMPSLNTLQKEFGGDKFTVATVATGRNSEAGIRRFFEEVGVDVLPRHTDPRQALARDMAVLGLPISVILNAQGQEIARLRGDALWDSDNAKAIIAALIGGDS